MRIKLKDNYSEVPNPNLFKLGALQWSIQRATRQCIWTKEEDITQRWTWNTESSSTKNGESRWTSLFHHSLHPNLVDNRCDRVHTCRLFFYFCVTELIYFCLRIANENRVLRSVRCFSILHFMNASTCFVLFFLLRTSFVGFRSYMWICLKKPVYTHVWCRILVGSLFVFWVFHAACSFWCLFVNKTCENEYRH